MKGVFITFEGGEGAGKTTLIEAMTHTLSKEGCPVLKIREPGGTELGEKIRNLLLHTSVAISPYAELLLFLASRAQHIQEVIRPALQAGKIVLCDRFNDSTIAYQGVARGLGMEEVEAFCRFISQGIEPDLTFYLDIDPASGLKRAHVGRAADRIEVEDFAFHQTIREAFLAIQRKDPKRFHLINATQSPAQIQEQAMRFLNKLLS